MHLLCLTSSHPSSYSIQSCMFLSLLTLVSSSFSRHEFDSEQIPDLTKDVYIQDIHCVGSLCKLYFRELPNPLLTYQLYEKFSVSKALVGLNSFRTLISYMNAWPANSL